MEDRKTENPPAATPVQRLVMLPWFVDMVHNVELPSAHTPIRFQGLMRSLPVETPFGDDLRQLYLGAGHAGIQQPDL